MENDQRLKERACRLIREGRAYIDFNGDRKRTQAPMVDLLHFQTYGLLCIGNGRPGVLRLRTVDNTDPILYERVDGLVRPTSYMVALE